MQVARSSLECRLYIELHPCDCGATASDLHHRMVMRDNRLTALYERYMRTVPKSYRICVRIMRRPKMTSRT